MKICKLSIFLLALVTKSCLCGESEANNDKYICSGGKNPSKMSKKEYLTAFGSGPCSPIIMLPGIGGSNMNVIIDCDTLRKNDPKLFDDCGWNACDGDVFPEGSDPQNRSTPKKEYLGWVPHLVSPMTLFSPSAKQKRCFAGLMTLSYDVSPDGVKVKQIPGITVKIVGTTPETRSKKSWDCGMDGVINIIPDIPAEPAELSYFKHTKEKLEHMGYISGLTVQAVPYDFRVDNKNDPIDKNFLPLIKEMYAMINKQIILLSHSMGSFRVYELLTEMDQADKDKYIRQYIAAAPVLVGAPQVNKYFFCGSKEYYFLFHLGIDFPTFKASLGDYTSMYQLLPTDYRLHN